MPGFAIVAAVLALAPLVILPGSLLYFDVTPKVAVVLLGTAAVLLLGSGPPSDRTGATGWFRMLLVVQAASLLLSTALSTQRWLSVTGTNWRRFGLVTQLSAVVFVWLFARCMAADPAMRVLQILRLIAACGALAAFYGILQYFGWDPWLPASFYHIGEGMWTIVRPPGTLGHAVYFANWLLYAFFAGVGLLLAERTRTRRLLGATACAMCSLAIVLSGTRAAVVGLAAGAVFLLFRVRRRLCLRAFGATALLLAGLAVFYFSAPGQKLRARVRWSLEDPRGGARLLLWRDTLRMAGEHWAVGSGPETFSVQFPRYQSADLARAYPDFYHESPHNIFLDALATQGILGLAVLLALGALAFRTGWRAHMTYPAFSGVLVAMIVAAIVSHQFTVFTLPTALYFYLNVAMLIALAAGDGTGITASPGGVYRVVSLVGRVSAAALFTVFAVRLFVADRALALTRTELEAGRLDRAIEQHRRALEWQPPGMNAELWYSRSLAALAGNSPNLLVRLQAMQRAIEAGERSTRSSEEPHNAWYSLAALYAVQNDATGVERCLRNAISASPNWYKPHWVLAQVLAQTGRLEEARKEAATAVDLNGGRNSEVRRTLDAIAASPRSSKPLNRQTEQGALE